MENEDKLSFLDGGKGASAPEAAAIPAAAPTLVTTEQPRDEHGKFAPKPTDTPAPAAAAPQPEPVAAAPAPQPAAAAPEPRQEPVPLATFLDVRDKLKAAEKRLAEFERRPQQPQPVPSATEQPEQYAAYLENIANSTRINTRFEMSEALATEKHGEDVVKGAMDWAMEQSEKSPAFAAEYMQQKHPIDWAVKQQKRHGIISQIGEDDEAYVRRRAAEMGLTAATPPSPQPAITPAAPQPVAPVTPAPAAPRSIASQPAAGASQHVTPSGPGRAFEAAFPT